MNDDFREDRFKNGVHECKRCKLRHSGIQFTMLLNPPPGATHWGICPVTQQPILVGPGGHGEGVVS